MTPINQFFKTINILQLPIKAFYDFFWKKLPSQLLGLKYRNNANAKNIFKLEVNRLFKANKQKENQGT